MSERSAVVVWGGGFLGLVVLFLVGVAGWESYQLLGYSGPILLFCTLVFWFGRTARKLQMASTNLRDPLVWIDAAIEVIPRTLLDVAGVALLLMLASFAF